MEIHRPEPAQTLGPAQSSYPILSARMIFCPEGAGACRRGLPACGRGCRKILPRQGQNKQMALHASINLNPAGPCFVCHCCGRGCASPSFHGLKSAATCGRPVGAKIFRKLFRGCFRGVIRGLFWGRGRGPDKIPGGLFPGGPWFGCAGSRTVQRGPMRRLSGSGYRGGP